MKPFDVCGPLPTGTTLLEASAGTGKTYTIGALVTRYVAEGIAPLERMLVVTFGRAASQELRERVRDQLVRAERALADPTAARLCTDGLIGLLATATDEEVTLRRKRLAAALADFDAATIATTHQFCQQVLVGLGIAGDTESGAILVEDLDDLVVEVVDDLYVRKYAAWRTDRPPFSRSIALQIAREAVQHAHARLEPAGADPASDAGCRVAFAESVRAEVDRRKRRLGILGYDDLLGRVADALAADDAPARDRMRARWSIVLVDEFQDTDPVQWQVIHRAFAGHATLVLVGDPKQAIYAFRGGDVVAYLTAAGTAEHQATLAQNWRSDEPLVAALQSMIGGAELGDPAIKVHEVAAAHRGSRLSGAPSPDPLRLRVVRRHGSGAESNTKLKIDSVRTLVARDLAADIATLLASGAVFDGRPLVAGDVAVLVATHRQARVARDALAVRKIPVVIAGAGSVYASEAADDWLVLLEALEQPHRSARTRAAALTPFVGLTAADLAAGGELLTDDLGTRFREWADLLGTRGVAALLEVATSQERMAARLLELINGERRLTDLRHVGQDLHAAAVEDGLGLAALLEWLRRRRREAVEDSGTSDRTRRLDSDAAAVQVVTLHASKGLEYPIVYLPFAFDQWPGDPDVLHLHDDDGHRLVDVGGKGSPGWSARLARHQTEHAGEVLRLLYVGLTRAQSQVVLWWAPSTNTPAAGLHRLLLGRVDGSGVVPELTEVPADDDAGLRFADLAERGGPVVELADPARRAPAPRASTRAPVLTLGIFERSVDAAWRRLSYTALTSHDDHASQVGVGSEPETGERDDEALPVVPMVADDQVDPAETAMRAVRSPMAGLPAGSSFGTLVHAILERTDPRAPDLAAELLARTGEQLARRPLGVTPELLAAALLPTLTTPLGPLAGDCTLQDIPVHDRLTELDFELPLAGGDRSGRMVTVGDLAGVIRRHVRTDDPLAAYAKRLESPVMAAQALRGYLTGSLDLVVRLAGPRYLVADYKTNWLGVDGGALTAWDYRPAALTELMVRSDYPLQAMLYAVALHRFLRWRQPAYDPKQHLGGVLYLFVRGMCGPGTPTVDGHPCGVFSWRPPSTLIEGLSSVLDGTAP